MADRICCLFVFLAVLGTCLAADCEYITRKYDVVDYFRVGDKNFTKINYINGNLEIHIAIKAASDGHIVLSPTPKPAAGIDPAYEIAIGCGSNRITDIRRNRQVNSICFDQTPDVLSATEFRSFYIKVSKSGLIEVGKEGLPPLVSCTDPNPLNVTYFGFSSWTNIEAAFKYDCPHGNISEQGSLLNNGINVSRSDSNVTELFVDKNYTNNVENNTIKSEQKHIVNETGSSVDEVINKHLSDENSNKTLSFLDEAVNKTIDDTTVSSEDVHINQTVNGTLAITTIPFVDTRMNKNTSFSNDFRNTSLPALDARITKNIDGKNLNKTYPSVAVEINKNVDYIHNDTIQSLDEKNNKNYNQTEVPADADEKNIVNDIHITTPPTLDEENNKTIDSMLNNKSLNVRQNSSKNKTGHELDVKTSVVNKTTVPCGGENTKELISNTENEVTLKISGTGIKGALFAHLDLAIYGDEVNPAAYVDSRQNKAHYQPYPYFGLSRPQD